MLNIIITSLRLILGISYLYFSIKVTIDMMPGIDGKGLASLFGLLAVLIWTILIATYHILNSMRVFKEQQINFKIGYWLYFLWTVFYTLIALKAVMTSDFIANLGLVWVIPLHFLIYYFVVTDFIKFRRPKRNKLKTNTNN